MLEAVEEGSVEKVEEKLSHLEMTDLQNSRSHTPLRRGVEYRRVYVVKRLKNVSVNRKDSIDGRTILSWTARYGYTQMASKLIQYQGVDLEARDVNGRTPLSEAAGSGSLGMVQLLIATDRVEVNSQDQQGQTSLDSIAFYVNIRPRHIV